MREAAVILAIFLTLQVTDGAHAQNSGRYPPNISRQDQIGEHKTNWQLTDGDNPLLTSFIWKGHGDAIVVAQAFEYREEISGEFVLSGIPEGSAIVSAFYVVTDWQESYAEASASFNGFDLGSSEPLVYDEDEIFFLSLYKWDVTTLVNGNDNYPFTGSDLNNSFLAYLVVVIHNPALPFVSITINDGAESLEFSSSTTVFSDIFPGNGVIKILTEAGNYNNSMEESIEFNGRTLIGPADVFHANIGHYADYYQFDLADVQIENSLSIITGDDWIGIHLAILIGEGYQSDIDNSLDHPIEIMLIDNYPNPFNSSTVINYSLPFASLVTISIYNVMGRLEAIMYKGIQPAGQQSVTWNADDYPSGIYFARVNADGRDANVKMVLLK